MLDEPFIVYYHTTKTIFGKDQRMPATGYISYPTPECMTHALYPAVSVYFYVDARVSSCDKPMYFPRNRGGFEQAVLLVFVLTFSTLCRIKIISFCSLKNGKII